MPPPLVAPQKPPTASSGSIVVELVGDEATVKTLHISSDAGGRIELRPENPDYEPMLPIAYGRYFGLPFPDRAHGHLSIAPRFRSLTGPALRRRLEVDAPQGLLV